MTESTLSRVLKRVVSVWQQVQSLLRCAIVLLVAAPLLLAETGHADAAVSGTAQGDRAMCVEPTEVMRRDHMEFILHQRDATVHRGIRTSKHSFKGCIDCHSTRKEDGTLVRHNEEKHFCAGCHVYVAVRIDCFECHTDRPQQTSGQPNARGRLSATGLAGWFPITTKARGE